MAMARPKSAGNSDQSAVPVFIKTVGGSVVSQFDFRVWAESGLSRFLRPATAWFPYARIDVSESESALTSETPTATGRFAALLRGDARTQECDRALLSHPEWIAAPTLGAIIPDWLIVVPRKPALNFRNWHRQQSKNPEAIIDRICEHLGLASDEIIWFEHGPAVHGSIVGCGADYAHLHILLRPHFPFEAFIALAVSMSRLPWSNSEAYRAYASLPVESSYLIAGSAARAAWALNVDATGSQFFRRVIASLSDRAEGWDYRLYAHADNIARTVETFRKLERDSRHVGGR
jgi:ATP adenylyltransferase